MIMLRKKPRKQCFRVLLAEVRNNHFGIELASQVKGLYADDFEETPCLKVIGVHVVEGL